MWKIEINRREWILKGALAAAIVGVIVGDVWLRTCGFDGCPSPREIQAYHPDEGGRIFDRNGQLMGRLAIVRRLNVPIAQVPVHVRQAFIATEDRRFYEHGGVDWRGFIRASLRNIKSLGVREGFSTITMQAARNSFVVNQYKSRSLAKKLIELRVTKLMENALTKDQILQLYLNAIYMGNGVYGVEAASRDLFGKSVSQLSVTEAAMLAALPKAPSAYTPRRNPRRALARRNLVLSLMVREGYISRDRFPSLAQSPLRIARNEWHPDDSDDSFALDAVRALTDSVLSAGEEDVADVTVYTTLDRSAQLAGDRSVKLSVTPRRFRGNRAAGGRASSTPFRARWWRSIRAVATYGHSSAAGDTNVATSIARCSPTDSRVPRSSLSFTPLHWRRVTLLHPTSETSRSKSYRAGRYGHRRTTTTITPASSRSEKR